MKKETVCLTALVVAFGISACSSDSFDYELPSSASEEVDSSEASDFDADAFQKNMCDRTVNQAFAIDKSITEQVAESGGFTEENIPRLLPDIERGVQAFQKAYECTSNAEYEMFSEEYKQAYAHLQNISNAPTTDYSSIDSVQQPSQTQSGYTEDFLEDLPVSCKPIAEAGAPLEVINECTDEHFKFIRNLTESLYK